MPNHIKTGKVSQKIQQKYFDVPLPFTGQNSQPSVTGPQTTNSYVMWLGPWLWPKWHSFYASSFFWWINFDEVTTLEGELQIANEPNRTIRMSQDVILHQKQGSCIIQLPQSFYLNRLLAANILEYQLLLDCYIINEPGTLLQYIWLCPPSHSKNALCH